MSKSFFHLMFPRAIWCECANTSNRGRHFRIFSKLILLLRDDSMRPYFSLSRSRFLAFISVIIQFSLVCQEKYRGSWQTLFQLATEFEKCSRYDCAAGFLNARRH